MIKPKFLFLPLVLLVTFKIASQEVQEKDYDTFQEFLTEQNLKISKINSGLNKLEVKDIMGESIIVNIPKVGKMKPLSKLFKQPEFTNEYNGYNKNKIYIYWYFSNPKDQNGIISKSECTPIVFENDSVVGKGILFFKRYRGNIKLN